jgi:ribose transport system ATP-binding protein
VTARFNLEGAGTAVSPAPFVRLNGISKGFGSIRALQDVDLDVSTGLVHGLVGANGAGKSTLLKILAGVVRPDSGIIYLDDREVSITNPRHARVLGLSFIHQELNVVPRFSAIQNMMLGLQQPTRFAVLDSRAARARVEEVAARLHFAFPLDVPVDKLSVAERWLVSIGHALMTNARLVAMDEPTASLSKDECEQLFRIVHELTGSGVAVLYVSHRLDEIVELSDTVSVLKDGQRAARWDRGEFSKRDLVRAIVGGEVPQIISRAAPPLGNQQPVLEVRNLRRRPHVNDVSFNLHAGEVLGLAGLVGSGRTEIVRMVFGAEQPESGTMLVDGRPYAPRGIHVAVSKGLSLVPEERRSQGLLLGKTITFNINLPDWSAVCLRAWLPIINGRAARSLAANAAVEVNVQMLSVDALVKTLSGGNQQKVVMSRRVVSTLAREQRSTESSVSKHRRAWPSWSSAPSSRSWGYATESSSWSKAES